MYCDLRSILVCEVSLSVVSCWNSSGPNAYVLELTVRKCMRTTCYKSPSTTSYRTLIIEGVPYLTWVYLMYQHHKEH